MIRRKRVAQEAAASPHLGLAPTYPTYQPPKPEYIRRPKKQSREAMAEEIHALRADNRRLKDQMRSEEQMDDEVWVKDGRIWFQHRCNGALVEQEISKGWKITSAGDITPSFSCVACNAHFTATVIVQLRHAGWRKPAELSPRYTGWQGSTPAGNGNPYTGYGYSW